MIGVSGNDFALVRLYWTGDNQGEWDEFVLVEKLRCGLYQRSLEYGGTKYM